MKKTLVSMLFFSSTLFTPNLPIINYNEVRNNSIKYCNFENDDDVEKIISSFEFALKKVKIEYDSYDKSFINIPVSNYSPIDFERDLYLTGAIKKSCDMLREKNSIATSIKLPSKIIDNSYNIFLLLAIIDYNNELDEEISSEKTNFDILDYNMIIDLDKDKSYLKNLKPIIKINDDFNSFC